MAKFVVNPAADEIDWENIDSYLFFNPRWPESQRATIKMLIPQIEGKKNYLWLMTSGSSSNLKCVGISKESFLKAATCLNETFEIKSSHTWLNVLPIFHVGGLAIYARAHLGNQRVLQMQDWGPEKFYNLLKEERAHWTSLVPTQVYDLLQRDLKAPPQLKGVFVGGGALREELYFAAREKAWPLLPTYGMTEASSQVATASLQSLTTKAFPKAQVLSHLQCKVDEQGQLALRGDGVALEIALWQEGDWKLQKAQDQEQWYWTQDICRLRKNKAGLELELIGRRDDIKKISGELVSLQSLQQQLDQVLLERGFPLNAQVHLYTDPRRGHRVVLVLTAEEWKDGGLIRSTFNARVAPYEKIHEVYVLNEIPRTEIGKVKRASLEKLIHPKPVGKHPEC